MTHPPEIDPAAEVRRALEASLYECKRVVVGQDAMLERLLVALLTGGHVLLEGVPGLAKTLTVRTLATVLGGRIDLGMGHGFLSGGLRGGGRTS